MKKLLIILFILSQHRYGFAQAPNVGVGFQVISSPTFPNSGAFINDNLPASISGNYKMLGIGYGLIGQFSTENKSNISYQFRMDYFHRNINMNGGNVFYPEDKNPYNTTYEDYTLKYNQFLWLFAPGIRVTSNMKKACIYSGFEIPYLHVGDAAELYEASSHHGTTKNASSVTSYSYQVPGGYMIGAATFVGLNFFVTKKITIGPEVYFGLYYAHLGGILKQETYSYDISDQNKTPQNVSYTDYKNSLRQLAFSGLSGVISFNYILQ